LDIDSWLRAIGLEQYAQTFRDNAIDTDVLRDLTDEHLRELGLPLGARLKLLRAVAALSAGERTPPSPEVTPPAARTDAERRQVTVMFSDLVGSTALSARMDPEDLREVISAYQKCVAETVRRFDGFVAKYLGDGVLVYFGYPQAHEDDAERSIRAALELIAAVSAIKAPDSLQTRVGIATGLVVVGDLVGSGEAQERGIVGETPNLAARLQGIAEPNSVVIAESTRKLIGNLFELEDLGLKELKGISGPVRAWSTLRPSSVESRFEALHDTGLTALVGREEEAELLLRRWAKAKSSEGQVVLLSGEPGIGKSRLAAALLERLADDPHTHLRYFCSPQHTDSALYPIISHMERAAGLAHDDTLQARLDKLDALLAQTSTSAQDAALFAEMLSLPNDGRYPALQLEPQQRRQKTLQALTAQVEVLARQSPVLMIFEDAHWADPTSLEVFSRTVDRIKTVRVLLLITFRPDFQAPWIGRPYVTALTINRLADRDIGTLIDRVIGDKSLPANIRQDIIERTDGIPLFVEEITKAVLEAASGGAAHQMAATVPVSALAVPASLQASLMSRLDRLGTAKEVAQVGAAIGREFPHALLVAVARKPERDLEAALDRLIQAGLLFRQGVPPHASYSFKHALVQDAAYGTLLREPRRALHGRISEAIENQFAEIAENQPELLAHHCTEAGLIQKASGLWGKAGQRSLQRSALVEAVEQFTRALDQISTLPSTPVVRREAIKLQVALLNSLFHVKGYGAPETKAAAERARMLIEETGSRGEVSEDPLLLLSVLYSFWVRNYVAFNAGVCHDLANNFLAVAAKQNATGPRVIGHRLIGASLSAAGDNAEGLRHYDLAIALYDPIEHRSLATRFGQDARVAILGSVALGKWALGYPDVALSHTDKAISDARNVDHAATLMYALYVSSLTHTLCGDYATAIRQSDEVISLADEKSAAFWSALALMDKGCVLALTGQTLYAIDVLTSGIAKCQSTGATLFAPFFVSNLAMAHADVGQLDQARHGIAEAIAIVEATGEKRWEAEVCRVAGEIALKSLDTAKARSYFERALAVARAQQVISWELRAAMSMARLWRDQGKRDEARDLLAPVYGWFTEGFDTVDLKEAKALLDELHA
jgi:predicted ATPase/class 3 adenylate cyclase